MEPDFTLPNLQTVLDQLGASETIALARQQVERLFGYNDVTVGRLKHFAKSHNCIVSHEDGCVIFYKMPPREGEVPLPQVRK